MEKENLNKLDLLKNEVDALQIEVMKGKGPWYKSPSIIISVLALLFSFSTTTVSFYKAGKEEVRSARSELRTILQRLSSLPKDNFELIQKYKNNAEGLALSGYLNQENSLLTRQATDIVDQYPEAITPSEYYSVALALAAASSMEKVPIYLSRAERAATDPNVRIGALRTHGLHLIATGQVSTGRKKYEQALSIWGDYPMANQYFRDSTNTFTEMFWAQAENLVNNKEAAKEHIRKAIEGSKTLPPGPMTSQLITQIQYTQAIIGQGNETDAKGSTTY